MQTEPAPPFQNEPMAEETAHTAAPKKSSDLLLIGGMLVGWLALQTWVLPGLGVPT